MNKKVKYLIIALVIIDLLIMIFSYLHNSNIAVLNPKGPIAAKERNLMYFALALSLIVVIPVFIMTFMISWKYRESNTKAKYTPEWDHSRVAETTWWLIPSALIFVLSVVAWNSSHALDPFKPLVSSKKALNVQVVALDWKWLFIYPQQHIASVNLLKFPVNTPLNFEITSDAPMNSFWIPQLGGQIYAMPGMSTQLHLMASAYGNFRGSSANISGTGFAGMDFIATSTSQTAFNSWVKSVQRSPLLLTQAEYNKLAQPSQNNLPSYYSLRNPSLYNNAIMKYMMPDNSMMPNMSGSSQMRGMDMGT